MTDYFHDHQQLSGQKAQLAARCAVYQVFQDLSVRSLTAIIKRDPTGIAAGDRKVFGDIVTECVTAAG